MWWSWESTAWENRGKRWRRGSRKSNAARLGRKPVGRMKRSSGIPLPYVFTAMIAMAVAASARTPHAQSSAVPAAKPGVVQFQDIARQAGLTALDVYGGEKHKEFIIETTGNGAAIFDYDNDGWPD